MRLTPRSCARSRVRLRQSAACPVPARSPVGWRRLKPLPYWYFAAHLTHDRILRMRGCPTDVPSRAPWTTVTKQSWSFLGSVEEWSASLQGQRQQAGHDREHRRVVGPVDGISLVPTRGEPRVAEQFTGDAGVAHRPAVTWLELGRAVAVLDVAPPGSLVVAGRAACQLGNKHVGEVAPVTMFDLAIASASAPEAVGPAMLTQAYRVPPRTTVVRYKRWDANNRVPLGFCTERRCPPHAGEFRPHGRRRAARCFILDRAPADVRAPGHDARSPRRGGAQL